MQQIKLRLPNEFRVGLSAYIQNPDTSAGTMPPAELKERFANDVKISEWKLGWESDRRRKLIPEDADFRSAVENIKEILD